MKLAMLGLSLVLMVWNHQVLAAVENVDKPSYVGASSTDLVQWASGLGIVVVLILCCAWCLRKMNQFPLSGDRKMKVLGGVSVGARERVVLVQVGEKQLVLGVAPGRVQTLHVLESDDTASDPIRKDDVPPDTFGASLRRVIRGEHS